MIAQTNWGIQMQNIILVLAFIFLIWNLTWQSSFDRCEQTYLWDTLDEQEVILAWLREQLGNNIQLSRQPYSARVWDQHFCNRGVFQVVTISSGIGLFYQKANADKQIALLLRSNCTLEECWTRPYKIGGNKAAVSSRSRTKTSVRILGRDANTWTM